MQEDYPVLISCKPIKTEFSRLKKINITSENDFSLGRALHNSVVIPSINISRNHCKFKKENDNWVIEDYSSCGVEVNGIKMGKGKSKTLSNDDIINFDSLQQFMYKFILTDSHIAHKRIKLEIDQNSSIIDDVKSKFEESQNIEIQHIEEKIQKQKQLQVTNKLLKDQVYQQINIKMEQLEKSFALQIENLKGEKDEVERQKILLIEERDVQIAALKNQMDTRITKLMNQIRKHNEKESQLVIENNSLKEKLLKEREEFLAELDKESSSKQDLLNNLQEKMRQQEEICLKEKKELENLLQMETEKLRLAKDKELNELAELSKQRELELLEEHKKVKQDLEKEIEEMKTEKRNAEQQINLIEASKAQMEVIIVDEKQTLQEKEKKTINNCESKNETPVAGPSTDTGKHLAKIEEMLETELQCSICAEIFVSPILLSCGHTFCKYCINSWKKKKKDCPVCRTRIKYECRSIVVESFLEKILPNLSDEMKKKREETLKSREEDEASPSPKSRAETTRRAAPERESESQWEDSEGLSTESEGEQSEDLWNFLDYIDNHGYQDFRGDSNSRSDINPYLGTEINTFLLQSQEVIVIEDEGATSGEPLFPTTVDTAGASGAAQEVTGPLDVRTRR